MRIEYYIDGELYDSISIFEDKNTRADYDDWEEYCQYREAAVKLIIQHCNSSAEPMIENFKKIKPVACIVFESRMNNPEFVLKEELEDEGLEC